MNLIKLAEKFFRLDDGTIIRIACVNFNRCAFAEDDCTCAEIDVSE